jgi:hypothetical protein
MGLDIRAISKIELEPSDEVKAIRERLFTSVGDEILELEPTIRSHAEYSMHTQDMVDGVYFDTRESQECDMSFSYGGYNDFRNRICFALNGVDAKEVWANPEVYENSLAYKVINFSDCEGIIGTTVSKEIYEQLVLGRDKYVEYVKSNPFMHYGIEHYDRFTRVFELGADEGIVLYR